MEMAAIGLCLMMFICLAIHLYPGIPHYNLVDNKT
jgi:hypothetical protein